jgi:hypothetical protein
MDAADDLLGRLLLDVDGAAPAVASALSCAT